MKQSFVEKVVISKHWEVLRIEFERVSFRRGLFVFLPDLDCFVALGGDHSKGGLVKLDVEDGCFGGESARLQRRFNLLEVVAGFPVVEVESPVVSSRYHYVVLVYGKRIDDGVMVFNLA